MPNVLIKPVLLVALAACLLPVCALSAKDKSTPRAADGHANGQIFNGKQNMPTILYGVAQEWNKACIGGDATACARLGSAFDEGLGDLDASTRIAVGFYKKACKLGDGSSCAKASTIYREGWAEFIDNALAFETAARGCDQLGNQAACASLGLLHFRGLAPASDRALVRTLWQNSCAAGENDGCRLQAGALFSQTDDAAAQARAIPLFEAACSDDLAWGCSGLADAYLTGTAVTKDIAKAERYAKNGCEEGIGEKIHVCAIHGAALVRSSDPTVINRGEQLLYHGCQDHAAFACAALAKLGFRRVPGATTTLLEAVTMARHGCDLGSVDACNLLIDAYTDGIEVKQNYIFIVALTKRSCALGDQVRCEVLTLMDPPDPVEYAREARIDPAWPVARQLAAALLEVDSGDKNYGFMRVARLMEEGDEEASWLLGNWFLYGLPGVMKPNPEDAMILIENAARVGHVQAAEFMGMAYWEGNMVAANQAKAKKYMSIAAASGSQSAAAILRSMQHEKTRIANAKAYEEGLRRWEAYFAQQKRMAAANAGRYSGSSASSSGSREAAAAWGRYERRADNAAFNSRVNNIMHGTACVGKYCP